MWCDTGVTIIRSVLLFAVAALADIGGAWLIWQGVREHKGLLWIGAGIAALGAYGFVATLQSDTHDSRGFSLSEGFGAGTHGSVPAIGGAVSFGSV